MDLISVIIPIFNAEKYLRKCLDSVLNQTYTNLQIILINDGSKDDSLKICQEYAMSDHRVMVIDQENSGVSAARNRGIAEASGDWFSFIDSDDYLELDAYSHAIEMISQYSCDAICYEYFVTYPDREIRHKLSADRYGLLDRNSAMHVLHNGNPFTWCRLFHRKLVEGIFFDTQIYRGEDTLFNTIVLHRASNVFYSDRPLYHYVQSEESACRGKFRPSQLTALKLIDFYPDFFSENYPELLQGWNASMCHLIISLYYDMYSDSIDYRAEMDQVFSSYKDMYSHLVKSNLSIKNLVKFSLFRYMKRLFCFLHKE